MKPWSSDALISALNWRYAVKKFDASKKISGEDWQALKTALVLTPSSYGLQPWRFIHIVDRGVLKKLTPASWNQSQVEDSSHYLVLCRLRTFSEAHIDKFLSRTAEVRGQSLDQLSSYRKMMVSDLVTAGRSKVIDHWASNQVYIALGNLMTCAAVLGIDTCPMEGIETEQYDRILDLESRNLKSLVGCALGYRSVDDRYATAKKVRFHEADIVDSI